MITPESVEQMAAVIAREGMDDEIIMRLQADHPGVRFTLCSDDDIGMAKSVAEGDGFRIYLVGGGDHCLSLTNDFSLAAAVVVAEVEEE